ncbi:hypothetical protein ACNQFN_02265 [Thauera butanivorans]|uniref:hypothetical protein n=1 Tax=Thauera butanivorans TaxID=86174 RepID=UPI003AB56686
MKKQKRLKPRNALIPILFNECGHAVHKNKRREERDRRARQEIKNHTRESGYFFASATWAEQCQWTLSEILDSGCLP